MEQPLVTVLMPVYNAEKFLKEAIESILQQTFTRFEFLIMDDASTDASVDIIRQYNDPRIKLIRNETNLGISATLNKGIAMSNTKWIARMDADDVSYPERLQKQYEYCEKSPGCALLSCWARVVKENMEEIRMEKYKSRYYFYNLTFECWMYHPTIFCRRDALLAIGGYTVPYSEDYELFWQISRRYSIWNLPEVLMDYRITSASLHQVTRKAEYEAAQSEQVLRNIRYYAGSDFQLSQAELECLRHNFEPLLKENNTGSIIGVLKKLAFIDQAILETENINKDTTAIKEASWHKRRFIILHFARNLPKTKAVWLLMRLGLWKTLYALFKEHLIRNR